MAEVSKETQMSIEASSMFPGFRFSPTDSELISYYLKKKIEGDEKSVEVISEVEICRHEPWDLPSKSVFQSDNEWFFFSARGRKYPNGTQSRRATELGYWKATGKERNVKSGSDVIGTKRTLVFHIGRAPKGERTEWIMHEYCMHGKSQDSLVVCRLRRNVEFRMNENCVDRRQISDGVINRTGIVSEGDKGGECSRKCSSSYDSHSIEQFDSTSESDHKLPNEATVAESSCQEQEGFLFAYDSDKEEDFYADILKDDIVQLDDPSFSVAPELLPLIASKPEAHTQTQKQQQSLETIMSDGHPAATIPSQGTANRRIKLTVQGPAGGSAQYSTEENKFPSSLGPKCVVTMLAKMGKHRHISIIFIILTLLVLLLALSGGSQHARRTT